MVVDLPAPLGPINPEDIALLNFQAEIIDSP